jgi:hypothetical protein
MSKDIKKHLKEQYGIRYKKYLDFFIEYINNGNNATRAYKAAVSPDVTDGSAAVLGTRILDKVNIVELLDYSGHGKDKLMEAMDRLLKQDPKEYVKYQDKFRKLSDNSININVSANEEKLQKKLEDFLSDE